VTGWIYQQQRDVIEYLQTVNRVLREQLAPHGVRFTEDQRVRLAAKVRDPLQRTPSPSRLASRATRARTFIGQVSD
jgi:hypothetical protein